ncbi:MAG: hypothetical protein J7L08_04295 [Candidatus Aenigmarchaeota archaeon]|nr:hypothetical protein [Candidatus Aenigmarchaeota archaeon]
MNGDEFQKQEEIEKLKKEVLRKVLTKDAIERLGRVRIVNPVLVQQVEAYLLQLYQMGQIKETIDDIKLKQILGMLTDKKDWSIKRR